MNNYNLIPLKNKCKFINGGTPSKKITKYFEGDIPWISSADINAVSIDKPRMYITEEAIENSATKLVPKGTVLLVTRTGVGKVVVTDYDLCFSQDITGIINNEDLDKKYLVHFLKAKKDYFTSYQRGATIKGITREVINNLKIPLPPLDIQKKIATALDKADQLRQKRKKAIEKLDQLIQSVFLDMFGDPVTNPMGWEKKLFGSISTKFSDGPFGSNLKTSHYVPNGIRVLRLQNIGVDTFINGNKAYISEEHFKTIYKHECIPGDIIIATLGDPNLRACILPSFIKAAINKADCIQLRVDSSQSTSEYLCSLINHPGMLKLAYHLMHGQTRIRVSMGTLRELHVPVPPLSLQKEYSAIYKRIKKISESLKKKSINYDRLFNSLLQRAFKGELEFNDNAFKDLESTM